MSLSNHTLIVPTYNRPEHLRRLVRYYSRRAPAMPILILDSSEGDLPAENARALQYYGDTLAHVSYPNRIEPIAKFADGVTKVKTETVSFCADDDVVFPDALEEAILFLGKHEDHVAAHGLYMHFTTNGDEVSLNTEYGLPGIVGEHPGSRVLQLLRKYEPLFYAVFRTPQMIRLWEAVHEQKSPHFQELFQSVGAILMGKAVRFPTFYGARQGCPQAHEDLKNWHTAYWFADGPEELFKGYLDYRAKLWEFLNELSPQGSIERDDFFKMMDLSHGLFFSQSLRPAFIQQQLRAFWPGDSEPKNDETDLFFRLLHDEEPGGDPAMQRIAQIADRWRRRERREISEKKNMQLNSEIRKTAKHPWQFQLPNPRASLFASDAFRAFCRELAFYLDQET